MRRKADKISAGFVESDDPYQKIKYFKKLIKFKNQNEASVNEISFVPHLSKTKDVIDRSDGAGRRSNNDESTTVIIDAGNKFAYDTINNNEDSEFASTNVTILGATRSNNRPRTTKASNEVVEPSSPEPSTNNINKNNEKQESAFDASNNIIKSQMGAPSRAHIGNRTGVDIESNRQIVSTTDSSMDSKNKISAVANNTSTDKSPNDFEIQRFISEHIKYKSNNVTIKKSWGKWSSWSGCSRSCGEGIMSQYRECTEKT